MPRPNTSSQTILKRLDHLEEMIDGLYTELGKMRKDRND